MLHYLLGMAVESHGFILAGRRWLKRDELAADARR